MKTEQEYNDIKENVESLRQAFIDTVIEEQELQCEDVKEWNSISGTGFEFEVDGIIYDVTISTK